jgi:hypothetical protein
MSDVESNDEGDIPAKGRREDEQAEDQVNGELKDEVEDTQTKSEDEDKNEDEDEDDDDDDVPEGESVLGALHCVPIISLNSV